MCLTHFPPCPPPLSAKPLKPNHLLAPLSSHLLINKNPSATVVTNDINTTPKGINATTNISIFTATLLLAVTSTFIEKNIVNTAIITPHCLEANAIISIRSFYQEVHLKSLAGSHSLANGPLVGDHQSGFCVRHQASHLVNCVPDQHQSIITPLKGENIHPEFIGETTHCAAAAPRTTTGYCQQIRVKRSELVRWVLVLVLPAKLEFKDLKVE